MNRRVLLISAAILLGPAAAQAKAATYCVGDPSCPATNQYAALSAALTKTNAAPDHDTIKLGGTSHYLNSSLSVTEPTTIVGAGRTATTLIAHPGGAGLYLVDGQSTVSGLTVRFAGINGSGIDLENGADATDVGVVSADNAVNQLGIYVQDPGSVITRADVLMGINAQSSGVAGAAGSTLTHSTVQGGIGVAGGSDSTPFHVDHTTIRASIGLRPFNQQLDVSDSLVLPDRRPGAHYFQGADIISSGAGKHSSAALTNVTVVGPGDATGRGVDIDPINGGASSSTATLNHVLITGEQTDIRLGGGATSATGSANASVEYSSYRPAAVVDTGDGGLYTTGTTNVTSGASPRFVDAAHGDYRLAHDSPLIDKGTAAATGATDLGGHPRGRDGDGNGTATRDIGAYEYQRLAPVAAFSLSPAAAAFGQTTSFASASTDPDGDPLTATWSFGDGTTGHGTTTSHRYAKAGTFAAKLTIADPTGLTATTSKTATVKPASPAPAKPAPAKPAPPKTAAPKPVALHRGRCANRHAGTKHRDVFAGTKAGDLISGGAGNDRLGGGAGDDCLSGGSGNDRLTGGSGADSLSGGTGNDRLDGGTGKDRLTGGPGNDRIVARGSDRVAAGSGKDTILAANGRKDRIDCGSGRDTVTADHADVLKHCEHVTYRRRR